MAKKKYSEEKLKYFEELIQKELKESIAYLEDISHTQSKGARENSGDLSSYAFHQADQGSDTNQMEQNVMLMEEERKKIRKLNDALRRLFDGHYGNCEMCGELISEARLEMLPYSTYCIDCKEKMEDKKSRQRR